MANHEGKKFLLGKSLSTRERGLKSDECVDLCRDGKVALYERAWIEICALCKAWSLTPSLSTRERGLKSPPFKIVPETTPSLSTRERGLKFACQPKPDRPSESLSTRERGLKFL